MPFFYVLFEGVTWSIGSQLATGSQSYRATIHRRFSNWVKSGLIKETYNKILSNYLSANPPKDLFIDSTDIQNKKMSKDQTYKSFKLSKQAVRLTLLAGPDRKPVEYSIEKAYLPDSALGYNLLKTTKLGNKKEIVIYGDKGYLMNNTKRKDLLKTKRIRVIVPKRRYKKKEYKTKNYKPKRKRIRHSNRMKNGLKMRIRIEHVNSSIHRSYKRLDKVFEKKMSTFNAFIQLAISIMILKK